MQERLTQATTIPRPLMAGLAVQSNIEEQISMLSRTWVGRPNVGKLIRMADLDLVVKTDAEPAALLDPDSGAVVNMVLIKGTRESALSQPSGITYAIPAVHVKALLERHP